jgi:uncharacterized damage-inducible protein DinB
MSTCETAVGMAKRLRQHQRFASRQLLEHCFTLTPEQLHRPFEIGMGSYWATVVHLYAAEWVWLGAIEGNARIGGPGQVRFESPAVLREAWDQLDARWEACLSRLDDREMSRVVSKFVGQTDNLLETPLGDILLHLATHAHYTVAQGTNILRRLGVSALPDTMLITMSRRERAGRI